MSLIILLMCSYEQLEPANDRAEEAIGAILHFEREEIIMEIWNASGEFPTCEEQAYEWDEEEYAPPEDSCYVDDLSVKVLPNEADAGGARRRSRVHRQD